ncbi:MAG: ParB/RepB/Spo0J family partition protein [Clostridiales bacterium]|jgi:ParB family chromosome partitioning protein|nr:ParB/RepB/Spo0J family partition protein [Clostridiales bacterium]
MKAEKEVKSIPINLIRPNTYQPRKIFSHDGIIELSQSIKEYGVLQPISVRRNGTSNFELIAGERRLRASQLAGLSEIPAIIVDITDTESAVMAMIENLQREDLNFLEEAEGYYNLIRDHNFTQEDLALRIGKKQSTIANKLRILKLSDRIKDRIIKEGLTERHGRALLKLPSEDLKNRIIDEIVKRGLNVKRTEDLIEKELKNLDKKQDSKSVRKQKFKWSISPKILTNTIKQIMDKNGIEAEYSHREEDGYMEIIVKIPKC